MSISPRTWFLTSFQNRDQWELHGSLCLVVKRKFGADARCGGWFVTTSQKQSQSVYRRRDQYRISPPPMGINGRTGLQRVSTIDNLDLSHVIHDSI